MHPLSSLLELEAKILLKKCICSYFQSSGAGGQKRNKVKSSVRLQLNLQNPITENSNPIELTVTATESRSSEQNLHKALHKIRLSLALTLSTQHSSTEVLVFPNNWPPFRYPVKESHPDLPRIAYRVLSLFVIHQGKIKETAQKLGTSSSTLVKFLYAHKLIWESALACRVQFSLSPLKRP